MRVSSPRAATPALVAALAAALLASLLIGEGAPLPTLPRPADGVRGAAGEVTGEHATDAPPGVDQQAGRSESIAVDPSPATGFSSVPAVDANGGLWIGHLDEQRGQVVVTRCADVTCATTTRVEVGADGRKVAELDMALVDGEPVLSHYQYEQVEGPYEVVLTRCLDGCHSSDRMILERGLVHPTATAVAVDAAGRPYVAYRGRGDVLRLARCVDPICSGVTVTSLTATGVDAEVGLALTPVGHPVVASRDAERGVLRLTLCADADCLEHRSVEPGGPGGGIDPAVVADAEAGVLVAHATRDGLELVRCTDATCASRHRQLLVRRAVSPAGPALPVGTFASLAVEDGIPVIAFYSDAERAPLLLRCLDPACAESSLAVVDDRRRGGEHVGLALTRDGLPVVTYRDDRADLLRLTRCATPTCGSAQPLSAPSGVTILTAPEGTLAVSAHPVDGLQVVFCPGGDCSRAVDQPLDLGGVPPVEAKVTRVGERLVVATRQGGRTTAVVRFCEGDCGDAPSLELPGVAELLALHAVDGEVEVLHLDRDGSIAVSRCGDDGCGRTRLLGTRRAHGTVAAAAGERAAVAWRDPVADEVWVVRCDDGCTGAPTVAGSWPDAGDLAVAVAGDRLALAIDRPDAGMTDLVACETGACDIVAEVPGRPLTLLADGGLVHLLVEHDDLVDLWTCNGACTPTATGLDAGLRTPAIVSVDPLRILGRDAATMHLVHRQCDRTACTTEGVGDTRNEVGVR